MTNRTCLCTPGFSRKTGTLLLSGLLCAAVGFSAPARADIAPNPGGQTVITNSTSAVVSYVDTPVNTRVDNYATTLLTFLNGGQISSQSFAFAFSDPTVQNAVTSADSILTGDGASFGPPTQDSLITALFSSVTTPPPTYSCPDFTSGGSSANPPGTTLTGANVTSTSTFGPNTIMVGDCQSDTFTILTGQLDVNINTEDDYSVARDIFTTDTYLTTAVYEIDGVTSVTAVPEPATWTMMLLGFGGIGFFVRSRRRHSPRTSLSA